MKEEAVKHLGSVEGDQDEKLIILEMSTRQARSISTMPSLYMHMYKPVYDDFDILSVVEIPPC